MPVVNPTKVKIVKTTSSPKFVTAEVTFATGTNTVTAAELGLSKIYGFAGGAWQAPTEIEVAAVSTNTPFATGGVSSVALRQYVTDVEEPANQLNVKSSILFWGAPNT